MWNSKNANITPMKAQAKEQYSKYNKQNSQVIFRRRRLGAVFIAALAIFVFVGIQLFRDYQRMQNLEEIKQEAISDHKIVDENVKSLKHEVSLLNDEDYVTKLARSRFFYSKDGEKVYPLPEQGNQTDEDEKVEKAIEQSQTSTTTGKE